MYGPHSFLTERLTPAVRGLLIATVAATLLQWGVDLAARGWFTAVFALSLPDVLAGRVWPLLTYAFLHADLWHLLFNLLGLFFFGPDVERALGPRRFTGFYIGCAALAGLGWLLLTALPRVDLAYCLGASGAVFGVLGAFAALFPERPVTLLVAFVLPVTLRARTLALLLGLIAFALMLREPGGVAHSAHLAGGAAGYLLGRRLARAPLRFDGWARVAPAPARRRVRWPWQPRLRIVVRPSREEVDRILDKINRSGLRSLTRGERETLDLAGRE
jgi:membrane associated rhomboid family serine protease